MTYTVPQNETCGCKSKWRRSWPARSHRGSDLSGMRVQASLVKRLIITSPHMHTQVHISIFVRTFHWLPFSLETLTSMHNKAIIPDLDRTLSPWASLSPQGPCLCHTRSPVGTENRYTQWWTDTTYTHTYSLWHCSHLLLQALLLFSLPLTVRSEGFSSVAASPSSLLSHVNDTIQSQA